MIQATPQGTPMWQALSTLHTIERRPGNRRFPVQQFVEQPHREVGSDERSVDDREPAGRNAVGVRDHPGSFREPCLCRPRIDFSGAAILLMDALVMGSLAVDTDLGETIIALGCPVVIVSANIKNSGDVQRIHKKRVSNRGVTELMTLPLLRC